MSKVVLYLLIGVVVMLGQQIAANLYFHQRWNVIFNGIKYSFILITGHYRVMYVLACILVLMLNLILWPLMVTLWTLRDIRCKNQIKQSIKEYEKFYEEL